MAHGTGRRRTLVWGAVVLVLVMLASGCSGDDGGAEEGGTAPAGGAEDFTHDTGEDREEAAEEEAVDEPAEEAAAEDATDEAPRPAGTTPGTAAGPEVAVEEQDAATGDLAQPLADQDAPFGAAPPATSPIAPEPPPEQAPAPPVTPGFTSATHDPLSTFATDVDTGSYTFARNTLRGGGIPSADTVRTEEFVNAIAQDYSPPSNGDAFEVHADGAQWPLGQATGTHLLRVGLSTPDVAGERQPATLTFVVDTSGSMADPGKLDLVKEALRLLVANLQPGDAMAIVAYESTARMVLPLTPWDEQADLLEGIARLAPGGSTNLSAGMDLGYAIAREHLGEGINRVILLSDGVANTGDVEAGAILERVAVDAAQGIEMVSVGVGLGSFNDALMERLADEGDGFYAYVDTLDEAQRLFSTDLVATLQTVAREARVQVEFNPAVVTQYRLIGFENRAVPDHEFDNDFRDAGEVGAGHQVTALYELQVTGASGPLAQVRLRWLDPTDGRARELARNIDSSAVGSSWAEANPVLQLDGVVAAWAETMRGYGFGPVGTTTLVEEARRVDALLRTGESMEVAELIGLYASVSR